MAKLDPKESIGMIIKTASKAVDRALEDKLHERSTLTAGQFKALAALYVQNGQTQKEIAETVLSDASTMVPVIDKLEQHGYVERRPDKEDRRINRIFLTEKSRTLEDFIPDCIFQVRKIISKDIPAKDLEVTKNTLKKITGNVESYENMTETVDAAPPTDKETMTHATPNAKKTVTSQKRYQKNNP